MKKKISICVGCYNEEGNAGRMADAIVALMEKKKEYDYEIIFADNASKDGTVAELREKAAANRRIKVICNAKNFGPQRSSNHVRSRASGDVIIQLPCDFQTPVDMIAQGLAAYEQGHTLVIGRKGMTHESKLMGFFRNAFYRLVEKMSHNKQYRNTTGFFLCDRATWELLATCCKEIPPRFLYGELGLEPYIIDYEQAKREVGKSSYSFFSYVNTAIDFIISFSRVPIRTATILGIFMSVTMFIIGVVYLVLKLIYWNRFAAGQIPLMIVMFFVGGVQILFIGLLGEYINLVLQRISQIPQVVEKETINFEEEAE